MIINMEGCMTHKNLKKYVSKEKLKDNKDRKTIQDKYKRYNNVMVFFSLFISVIVVFTFMLLFDYQVLRPQDNQTNIHFSERTAVVSSELATLLTCSQNELENPQRYVDMEQRLIRSGILVILTHNSGEVISTSELIDKESLVNDIEFALEILREKYIIEKHFIANTDYTIYFLVPKSDSTLMKKNFLTFIAAIFTISALFRWGFSRSIMKRVYKNMVEPLEKIKKGTTEIRKGNLDYELDVSPLYNRDIKETFNEFEKMREKLKENKVLEKQYESNRKELISNISHDLKTPIASILGYVEGVLDGVANTPAKHDRYMQIIYKKSLDMNRLVNDLILFSQLDVNKVVFRFEKCRLVDYIEVLFEEYGIELSENGIELVSRYQAAEDTYIYIDKKQLRRVFNNIIGNAMKHLNKETKAIEIVVYEEGEEIVIRISDNGDGIEQDKVDYIFDRFYKADDSRNTEIGSSGLGLSISKQIVLAHGGKIWATSEHEKGTTIYFTLSKEIREV